MGNNANGWPIISKWLGIREKRQADLARQLNISPSAISQLKKGDILLNAGQMAAVLEYLRVSEEDVSLFYTEVFNARMGSKEELLRLKNSNKFTVQVSHPGQVGSRSAVQAREPAARYQVSPVPADDEAVAVKRGDLRDVPVLSFAQAAGYEPAIEPFDDFARDCSDETAMFTEARPGFFALRVEGDSMSPEYPNGTILLVAGGEYPQRGDIVVAKLSTGQVVVKRYSRKDNIIKLESENPNGMNFSWHCKEDAGYVLWMYPVIEVTLKLRNRRWERARNGFSVAE
ncbi:MAG: XRE family transcriptional regulator [Victivallaceae bacterium]|jgi:SOS-response transcriptional repressor LexA